MMQRLLITLLLGLPAWGTAATDPCPTEGLWEPFVARFVSRDGRVIDPNTPGRHTTSEGQAYALFFALVANDRERFETLLRWTENNLAGGDLTSHLPAWQWGRDEGGEWRVLDDNAASDADLWLAYTLAEAGRLWQEPRFAALGELLADRILSEETLPMPGLGTILLPAPRGFDIGEGMVRLNPSYLPLQLLRRLDTLYPGRGWAELIESSARLLRSTPSGFAPDWLLADTRRGFLPDPEKGATGSYDAIRVYLWAGMLDPVEPLRAPLLAHLAPMAMLVGERGVPPHRVDTLTGRAEGSGPPGFSAALLPFLRAQRAEAALRQQCLRLTAHPLKERAHHYYDHVLTLFGLGWHRGLYRFDAGGRLIPRWSR